MRFDACLQFGRRRAFLTIAKPSVVFFVIILWRIVDNYERFLHPWREQSNTGNDKNERVSMHFCRSGAGEYFWPLRDRAQSSNFRSGSSKRSCAMANCASMVRRAASNLEALPACEQRSCQGFLPRNCRNAICIGDPQSYYSDSTTKQAVNPI